MEQIQQNSTDDAHTTANSHSSAIKHLFNLNYHIFILQKLFLTFKSELLLNLYFKQSFPKLFLLKIP